MYVSVAALANIATRSGPEIQSNPPTAAISAQTPGDDFLNGFLNPAGNGEWRGNDIVVCRSVWLSVDRGTRGVDIDKSRLTIPAQLSLPGIQAHYLMAVFWSVAQVLRLQCVHYRNLPHREREGREPERR